MKVCLQQVCVEAIFDSLPEAIRPLFHNVIFPWEIIPLISEYIIRSDKNQYREYSNGIWVGNQTDISDKATLIAPAIIGDNCVIRPGAYIRGNAIIGNNCVIGNSTEVKNSVVMNNVQLPHYNYVGDSVLGNYVHLGAGVICSNLKSDKGDITVRTEPSYETRMRKLGAIIGNNVEVGCNCVINPGTVIGQNTRIYPLISVRGAVPANCIMKSFSEIVLNKQTDN